MTEITVALVLVVLLAFPQISKKIRLARWRSHLKIQQSQQIFNKIYHMINGYTLSQQARKNCDQMSLTYGEINFEPFVALLSCIPLNPNSVFCDLGCGTGKTLVAITLCYDIKQAIGIECLEQVYQGAYQARENLAQTDSEKANKIKLMHADFLDGIPTEVTIVFINAAAFFGDMWQQVISLLKNADKLETIISTKQISHKHFTLQRQTRLNMSWGPATTYIYQLSKKSNG